MLDIDLSIMGVTLAIFFIMLYILNAVVFRPLLQFMDARDSAISKDLKSAQNLGSDSDKLISDAKENIDEAKAMASQIRQEAVEEGKAKVATAIARKQNELEGSYEQFTTLLTSQKKELETSLLSQMPLIKESMKAKFSQL